MPPVPRPGILDVPAYVGGQARAPGAVRTIKLASNESALGPSARAVAAYHAHADRLALYPEGVEALRRALADRCGVAADRIVCGAGSDDLIILLNRAYAGAGDEVIHTQHGFLIYKISATQCGAAAVSAPERGLTANVDALLAAVTPRTRLMFIANPNNPTGTFLTADEIGRLHRGLPDHVILAIDAAYAEYIQRDDYTDGLALARSAPNVVMLRTFSKIYGLAALRLGWALCPPAIADVLNRLRAPFNVAGPAIAAGLATLEDEAHVAASRAYNDRQQPWLAERLSAAGVDVAPSVANFLLARFPDDPARNADAAFDALLREGVILRKVAAYGLPHSLRITVGPEDHLAVAVDAIRRFMAA